MRVRFTWWRKKQRAANIWSSSSLRMTAIRFPSASSVLPIDRHSIAGYAADTGEVLNIKDAYRIRNLPFQLNRDFDRKFGYRTKSMLVVPMKNHKDEVIGVLQLINAKQHREAKLTSLKVVQREVVPFTKRSQDLAASLASQAAVAVENNLLYRDIQNLFESFVEASVIAIESRDPTTFGHSERVAKLTVGLAEAVNRIDTGPYKDIHFTHRGHPGDPLRINPPRFRQGRRARGSAGESQEALPRADGISSRSASSMSRKHWSWRARARNSISCFATAIENYEQLFSQIDEESRKEFEKLDEFLQNIIQGQRTVGSSRGRLGKAA